MSGLVSLKTDSWDLAKGTVEEVDTWPLMASPGPAAIILASYLIFVLRVGPKYMEKREPYQLKWVLIVYNAAQVVFSVFLAAKCLFHILRYGLVHSKCIMNDQEGQSEVVSCIWWYFMAKVTEFLDTVFFVLRKKNSQLSFLHIYHHSVMMGGTWTLLKYGPTDHVIFAGFLNCFVHVIMYTYYALSAMGPNIAKYLWWKKYLTRVQLIQFVSIAIKLYVDHRVSECPMPRPVYWWFMLTLSMFFFLFADYYRKEFFAKYKAVEKKLLSEPVAYSSNGYSTAKVKSK